MPIAIKVENVSKAYRLGMIGTGTISNDLKRWYALRRGKEDPFLKIGETNDRTVKGKSDVVWSLKDISFEIEEGDAVGIIGRNGAGKSTLLKILSRVTSPTTGTITGNGRVASLLEVGTGFHPELTGKDNIYLNGAILGMRKKEIKRKFDEIVDFAGVERYIDTPVKRYSSGMYVRLAFAVAAYLESEILIVDEVLAVGDSEFQRKCLGKMNDVSKGEGRTILFVSHNMAAVSKLCSKSILLNQGSINQIGESRFVIEKYLSVAQDVSATFFAKNEMSKASQILKAELINYNGNSTSAFAYNQEIYIQFTVKNFSEENNVRCAVSICNNMDQIITVQRIDLAPDNKYTTFLVKVPPNLLVPNNYRVALSLYVPQVKTIELLSNVLSFGIIDTGTDEIKIGENHEGIIFSNMQYSIIKQDAHFK